jgi:hypothetical protein
MWIVRLALRRPYTFVVMALVIILLGIVTETWASARGSLAVSTAEEETLSQAFADLSALRIR